MDILHKLNLDEIGHLRDLYENVKFAPYAYGFLQNVVNWKKLRPSADYVTVYSPITWRSTGTFIGHVHINCNQYVVFTLEESQKDLYDAIVNTKVLAWTNDTLFYALHEKYRDTVIEAIKSLNMTSSDGMYLDIFHMDKNAAKEIDIGCPNVVKIDTLQDCDVKVADDVWPNNFDGSFEYLKVFKDLNLAFGVYRKSDNVLVSWAFQVFMRSIVALQTAKDQEGKGYATLVLKQMTKAIGEQNVDPMATVSPENIGSQKVFAKVGYKKIGKCYYISVSK